MSLPLAGLHFSHQLRLEYLSSDGRFALCSPPVLALTLHWVWKSGNSEGGRERSHVCHGRLRTEIDKSIRFLGKCYNLSKDLNIQ